jgi:outer membrane usher protein
MPVRAAPAESLKEAVLEISVNQRAEQETLVVLRDSGNGLWLEEQDFAKLRLRLPPAAPRNIEGRRYYPLNAIAGLTVTIDELTQSAAIMAPANAFLPSLRSAPDRPVTPLSSASPGAFLNYQLSAQHIGGTDAEAAQTELGLFGTPGVLTNTAVARTAAGDTQFIRLDTTFTHDFVGRLETLNLGDSISDTGSWGYAVRFAGLRWGSNFGIRPDLITTPLLTTGGSAVVPSTVDIFVNSQRVSSQDLPPGPFVINNLPAMSGSGDVSVVVRDALGREQVMTQSFYSSPSLLAPGLAQYSVDLGPIRENYALASAQYGAMLGAATYRRGLSDALTLEGHGEFLAGAAHAAGLNLAARLGTLGVFNATAAAGGEQGSFGSLGGAGFEHHGGLLSFSASTLFASSGFHQVADAALTGERFKQRSLAQLGVDFHRAGSLSLAYVLQTYASQPQQQTLSLTDSVNIGTLGSLSLTLSRTRSLQTSTSAFLIFTRALGQRQALSAGAVGGSGPGAPQNAVQASLIDNPPVGPGMGYRLSASTAGNYDADWREQMHAGDLELEAARNQGISGQSAFFSGAATWLDGDLRAARTINGSFAVVDVAGIADVPVYLDNQLVTHTDQNGRALLYNLRQYEDNRIGVDPVELPLDTSIAARTLVLAPAYRSGVIARFPVDRVHGGTFRLLTDAGNAVPAGALVHLKDQLFPVALDGVTYVTGFDHGMTASASWPGGQCRFRLAPPPHDEPLPDLGTVTCYLERPAPPQD